MAIFQSAFTIVLFFFILVVLVVVHELGHFVVARLLGIRVLEFGIGFPPRAKVLRSRGETLYTLNWLPIGGFVKLEGEDGESDDPRSFVAASLWRKLLVLVAGVAMNLLLAFALFAGMALLATPQGSLSIGQVLPGSPAASAGLVAGDQIEAVNGKTFDAIPGSTAASDAVGVLRGDAGQTVTLHVRSADGSTRDVTATLRTAAEIAAGQGALGISINDFVPTGQYAGRDLGQAISKGASWTTSAFTLVIGGLGDLAHSIVTSPTTAPPVSGPVGIAATVGNVFWQEGPIWTLYLAALLSANLALVNFLPIPPLDGGRALVVVLKSAGALLGRGLRRAGVRVSGPSRQLAVTAEQLTYLVGFVFLLGFLAWVSYFDIARQVAGTP